MKFKKIEIINEVKCWVFENISVIDSSLVRITTTEKEKRHKLPISGIKQELSVTTLQASKR